MITAEITTGGKCVFWMNKAGSPGPAFFVLLRSIQTSCMLLYTIAIYRFTN